MSDKPMINGRVALELKYPFVARRSPVEGWNIIFPDLPGRTSWAPTRESIARQARGASRIWLESMAEDRLLVPASSEGPDGEAPELAIRENPATPTLTSSEVARQLGISVRRVNALSKSRKVGRRLGNYVVYTPAEVERLRPGSAGRPRNGTQSDAA